MIVYLARNVITGDRYVGQTSRSIDVRVREHLRHCRRTGKNKGIFHKALLKYGAEAFRWSVLGRARDRDALDRLEQAWIDFFKCRAPNGYNLECGGNRNKGHSPQSKALIAAANTGVVFSDERRARISKAKRGQKYPPRSQVHERKLSECKLGENNPACKLTDEQVAEVRALLSEGKLSQRVIATRFGVSQSAISSIKMNKRRTQA
ncbi:NUMOD3 domain-containing DNA-binding protein [Sphingomonas sp. ACRSK]|uniref:NUMOD3 domain-containing DNA-binding protein n=1 Tax=Sphingomonas sp. ACRSK TaxID=2918213 RepID=UPI001EF42781|nr:NUMOD3 domain-containing DNA-binding protein [Sphingomonas sp. ACRSK]MCG7348897.1 GIY-YIG nuclease family protein [Sphingomonas sp. ACRSK]